MATYEIDALDQAIAATEKEIFVEAFGKEEMVLDETGDRALEEMGEGLEGQHEAEEGDGEDDESELEAEGDEEGDKPRDDKGKFAKPEDKGKTVTEPNKGPAKVEPKPEVTGRVPPGVLREAKEKTRTAEAERDALKTQLTTLETSHKQQLDALNAKFDGVLAAIRQQQPDGKTQQTNAKPVEPPDFFEDPKGFMDFYQKQQQAELQDRDRKMENLRIDSSMQAAHVRHGKEFETAYQALVNLDRRNPENLEAGKRIIASPNPGESLVQWYKRNEVLRLVGDDPAKYEQELDRKIRERLRADPDFLKEVLGEARDEAMTGENGKPRTLTRLPRSLNQAGGNNSNRPSDPDINNNSDRSVFDFAFR